MLVATPSGVTLAPEGGAHQSIGTPLIGMAQDGLAAFEPAFVDELRRDHALGLRLHAARRRGRSARSATGCATRPAARSICASRRGRSSSRKRSIDAGACARRSSTAPTGCASPGRTPRSSSPIPGAVAPEAIEAVGLMAEDRRDVGLLAVTSADRLTPAGRRRSGRASAASCMRAAISSGCSRTLPPHCGIVTVIDGHPATLAWLGAVAGHRTRSLGVEHFGQTGTIPDLYRHYGIDAKAIVAAAEAIAPGQADPPPQGNRHVAAATRPLRGGRETEGAKRK